jgi:hypothetical protein
MTTITIEINEKTKAGKILKSLIEVFSKENKDVKIVSHNESPYSPEFVEKIKKGEEAIKNGKTTRLNPQSVWENIL